MANYAETLLQQIRFMLASDASYKFEQRMERVGVLAALSQNAHRYIPNLETIKKSADHDTAIEAIKKTTYVITSGKANDLDGQVSDTYKQSKAFKHVKATMKVSAKRMMNNDYSSQQILKNDLLNLEKQLFAAIEEDAIKTLWLNRNQNDVISDVLKGSDFTWVPGTKQVTTATVVATITGDGNVSVTVTGARITGSPVVVPVAVVNGDAANDVAGKIRTALAANAAIIAAYDVSGATNKVILTEKNANANDATLNIALATGTATGLTAAPTSAATTAGVEGYFGELAIANKNEFYGSANGDMKLNNYTDGEYIDIYNTTWQQAWDQIRAQGAGNSVNYGPQEMPNWTGVPTNKLSNLSGYKYTHIILPQGAAVMLYWTENDKLAAQGIPNPAGWDKFTMNSVILPSVTMDVASQVKAGDTSATGGGTQDNEINYEVSVYYALVMQPFSTANESAIFARKVKTT